MVKQKTTANSTSAISMCLCFVLLSALLLGRAIVMAAGLVGVEMIAPYYTASLCYLVPLIVFIGAVSPLLIRIIHQMSVRYGRTAGDVYATSATGIVIGILFVSSLFAPQAAGVEPFALLGGIILAGAFLMNAPDNTKSVILEGAPLYSAFPFADG